MVTAGIALVSFIAGYVLNGMLWRRAEIKRAGHSCRDCGKKFSGCGGNEYCYCREWIEYPPDKKS